jgi:hypothetical protein
MEAVVKSLILILPIIVGIVYGFRSIFRLIKMEKYKIAILFLSVWFGFPPIAYYLFSNQVANIWVDLPLIVLCFYWLIFGYVIRSAAKRIESGMKIKLEGSKKRRIVGFFIVVLSIITMFLGTNNYFIDSLEVKLFGSLINTLIFIMGLHYLISGKPIDSARVI